MKQIDAGDLNVGYAEAGPPDGPAVLLLHGWPYDIHSYVDVAPLLAAGGYRVIVPYARGYGSTSFLSSATPRNGQQAVIALDSIALMDALQIERAIVAGFDWGARTANIVAALWPERCTALVSVSGYLIGSQAAGQVPLPPAAELQWWYWRIASPNWSFDAATFDRSAVAMPTGRPTPTPAPTRRSSRANTSTASSPGGIGHNLPQAAPRAFAEAIFDVDRF